MGEDDENKVDAELESDVIEDLEPLENPPEPPCIAPPKLGPHGANPIQSSLSSDDVEFIGKVFAQVRHVDFKAPVPEGNPRLTGIDKKLFGLREQVRKLERDLARVSFVWCLKQSEIDSAAEWVRAKDEDLLRSQKHFEEASDKLSNVEEELVALRSQAAADKGELEEKVEDLQDESKNLKLNLLALQEELDKEREDWAAEIESAHDVTARKSEQAAQESQRSQRAYDALKGLSQSEKEAHALQQQSLRLQNAELQERLTQVEIHEIELHRSAVQTTAELKQRSAQLEANSKTVLLLKVQIEALETSSKEEAVRAQEASEKLRAELQALSELNCSQDSRFRESQEKLEATLAGQTKAEDQLVKEQARSKALDERLSTVTREHRDEMVRQRATYEQVKAVYGRDTQAAEQAHREFDREIGEARTLLADQTTKVDDLERQLHGEQMANLKLGAKVKNEQELNSSSLGTIQMLQGKLREANQSLTDSQSGFVEMKARLDSSESDKDALVRRLSDLEN